MRHVVIFFFVWLGGFAYSVEKPPTICLNMIVKNEAHVIERCLTSTLPLIDTWVIVDTGSSDGTQEKIRQFFREQRIEGELFERPWVNFEHNRNEALQLAAGKADYVLFMDADDYLEYEPDFELPLLDKGYYHIRILHGGSRYDRIHLINNHLKWSWQGVLHESLITPHGSSSDTLSKIYNRFTGEGFRSKDPEKYLKDAKILEEALVKEPNNHRYAFYLAQSYVDGNDHQKALKAYENRAAMGGWDQEVYWSLYRIGDIKEALNKPKNEVIESYMKAFKYRPSRCEPLYQIMRIHNHAGEFEAAYRMGKVAINIPDSHDSLFYQHWIHNYGIPLELSVSAYWTDRFQECQQLSLALLKKENLPSHIKECVEANLGFANGKLAEQAVEESMSSSEISVH